MTSITTQDVYWDKVSTQKTFGHPVDAARIRMLLNNEAHILDYGCGYGRTCADLQGTGFHNVMGVDTSAQMIERGKREHPELRLYHQNDVILADNSFDAVLLFAVLTCIPDNESQQKVIADIWRILKPNGIIYVSDYWIQNDERYQQKYRDDKPTPGIYGVFKHPEGATFRHHHRDWINTLLNNFEKIDLYDINVRTMNGHEAVGFQYLGRRPK